MRRPVGLKFSKCRANSLGRLGRLSDVKLGSAGFSITALSQLRPCLPSLAASPLIGQWYIPGPCSQAWMERAVQKTCKCWACCTRLVGVRHSAPYRNRAPLDMSPAPRARFCRYLRSQHSAAHLHVRGGLACTWYIPCLDSCTQSLQTYACRAVSATTVRKKVPAQFKKVELCLPRDPMPLQGVWVGFQDGNQLRSR